MKKTTTFLQMLQTGGLLLLMLCCGALGASGQSKREQGLIAFQRDSVEASYELAFAEMKAMLEGEAKPSFKRAVFLTENAWFANRVSYFDYDSQIKALAHTCRKIAENGVELPSERHKSLALNYAIFKFMTDTTRILEPGRGTSVFTPFRYDFADVAGADDWRNTFVMKLLVEKRGNCRALPYLYKMLADELGAEATLSLAPNHVYIKHRGAPDPSGQRRMYNVELTSASFPKDSWIMASGYITLPGIQNSLYMDTLSREESIALCLTDLAQGYLRRLGGGPLADRCVALALKHHPENANALLLQAELLLKRWQADPTRENYGKVEAAYAKLIELGHRQMPEQMYLDWLISARTDGESYYKTDTAAPRFDPRENAPDPDMPYQTLTNGYYDECPLCDSLIVIGEVRLNTNTGKIVGFIQRDTLRSEATLEPTVVSRWLSVDPVVHPYSSPYVAFENNPIYFIDPTGTVAGDYYSTAGGHLGSDGIDDNKVYAVPTPVTLGKKNGKVIQNEGAIELDISHSEFQKTASIVKEESSGSFEESRWIAHSANNAKDVNAVDGMHSNLYEQLISKNYSSSAKTHNYPLSISDNSTKAISARAGVIDALIGQDPTGGAVYWDGTDFLEKGIEHNKIKREAVTLSISFSHYLNYERGATDYKTDLVVHPSFAFSNRTQPGLPANSPNVVEGVYTYRREYGWMGRSNPFHMPSRFHAKGGGPFYHYISAGAKGATIFWKIHEAK